MSSKPKVIIITGPTSSGKTSLSIKIAKKQNGEVISADSRQIYKGLDISTGKVTKEEMSGINHHLTDIRHPNEILTTHEWKKLAEESIKSIISKDKIPIVAGGTGFYINSLIENYIYPSVSPDPKLRAKLEQKTTKHLQDILGKLDKVRLEDIDQNNRARLIRSIEIATKLGKVPKKETKPSPYDFEIITLLPDREELKKQIKKRTKTRIKAGMVEEIKKIHEKMDVSWKRLEELGFDQKYVAQFLQNKISEEKMTELILRDNWRYAKRQYTWIRQQLLDK